MRWRGGGIAMRRIGVVVTPGELPCTFAGRRYRVNDNTVTVRPAS
jgi:hypothetical protein